MEFLKEFFAHPLNDNVFRIGLSTSNFDIYFFIPNADCCVCILFHSVLIGAPRAQSTLEMQRNINETGAVYKCNFDKSVNGKCSPFTFDKLDNYNEGNDELTFNNEKKDYQWLGASMDGSSSDSDKFVVSTYWHQVNPSTQELCQYNYYRL